MRSIVSVSGCSWACAAVQVWALASSARANLLVARSRKSHLASNLYALFNCVAEAGDLMAMKVSACSTLICPIRRVRAPLFEKKLTFISLMDISSLKARAMGFCCRNNLD